MSNVDTLLDFDSPPEKGPSQSQAGNGPALDPFDPFGPSPTLDSKAGNGLLLDFETNVQNGASTENGGDNVNLLYEFESGNRNDLYNLGEEDDSVRTEDLAALIKQQSDEDEQIVVTESVTRDEGGQTTVVTTRRSRSYDSDRELSPEVEHVVEESMTTSDDGMVVRKVIKTTTMQSEYLDESSDFSDQNRYEDQSLERESLEEQTYEEQPSLEEQTYEEQPSVEEQTYEEQPSVEEQTYEERPSVEEQLYEEREESSFDERLLNVENQSYEDNPSVDNQSYEDRSQEGSLVEVSYEERSYDDNPSFTEQHAEDIEAHKRRSMTPSPSSSDDEQQQTLEDPHKRRSMSPSPAEIRGQPETKNTSHQVRPAYEHLSLNRNTRSTPDSVPSHGRRISDENQYEVINFDPAPARDRQYSSLYETLSLNTEPNSNHRYRFGSSKEEEIIKNGATFYRTEDDKNISEQTKNDELGDEQEESQTMVKEELGPGQLKSPFFGDGPKPENGVHLDESDVERDPNIAREVRSRDQIKFAELSNFKNKFEAGVESKKSTTVSSAELDKVRQSSGAGSLKNKFENAGKDDNLNQERKAMREITPPQPDAKIVYEKEAVRDPNVIRSEDVIDEGVYMPKPGSSKEIRDKFKSGKIQESAPTQRSSVIDEIKEVEGGVYENEPQINPDVVRSGEGDQFADLPSTGSTRSVLSKFKQMESSTGYVPAPRGVREITPPSGGKVEYVSEPTAHVEKYEGKAESGVFESKPEYRPDVVRSGELPSEGTEQLPQQGFTKSAAALFRQKEAEAARVKTASTGGLRPLTPPRDQPVVYENEPQRLPDVVRSEDKKEVDLPQSGSAKNMLAKFRQWESTGGPPNQVQRQPKAFTPPREGEGGVYENTPEKFVPDYGNTSEGGVYENQPQHRDDVVRSDVRAGEELPGQGSAKNMVAKFRQLGDSTKSQSPISPRSPHDRSFKEFTPPREDPRSPGIQPADMPDQYQQASGGVSESKPQLRDDVVREADTDYEAGMPAPSTTKNLLARFKAIQQDVKTKEDPKPLRKESPQLYNRPSPSPNTPNSKEGGVPRFRAVQPEKCASCQKTVYAMEKMEFNKNVYHKTCFKCSHCKNRLTPATFSVNQGILYCLNHFKQMFKTKGNYDEGFGREQYKKKWKSEPNIAGLSDDEHAVSRS